MVEKIKELVRDGASYRDMLVLYRTNAQSRVFEETLVNDGIPYKVVGGVGFYARAEVKDVLAYLRYIVNPADSVSFKRIINVPRRSIGQQTVTPPGGRLQQRQWPIDCTIFRELLRRVVPKKQKELEAPGRADRPHCASGCRRKSVAEMLVAVMEDSGYLREFQSDDNAESRARIDNLQELVAAAQDFEQREEGATVESFLANLALASDLDELVDATAYVTLMTLHAAKGCRVPARVPHRSRRRLAALEARARRCGFPITRLKRSGRLHLCRRHPGGGASLHVPRATALDFRQHGAPRAFRFLDEMPSVQQIGTPPVARPAGGRWREVSIHEPAGACIDVAFAWAIGCGIRSGAKASWPAPTARAETDC